MQTEHWLFILIALPVSLTLVWLLTHGLGARLALDQPNARSLHTTPIPRTGGLGMLGGMIAGWLVVPITLPPAIWAGAGLLAGLSFFDDRYGLPTSLRFLAHALAALWLINAIGAHWSIWLWPLVLFSVVWMTNLYNFMDGSDGLAGGMAVFGFGTYALAAVMQGQADLALTSAVIAIAAVGFLIFNFPPARVFMGDAGSIPLGFLAAGLGLLGTAHDVWPGWFPLLVFAPFILDASVTLLHRGLRGEKIWHAHKEHYYQRLIRMGWSHRKTALAEYVVMFASGGVALICLFAPAPISTLIVALWGALLVATLRRIDRRWHHFQKISHAQVG